MLVTIIVPAYNYGHYIGQTLESVRAQTFENWECLIIDDGSSDNTKAVVAEYCEKDPRIKYIFQNNQGLAAARNTGIRLATGQFIQFLDADDLIAPRKLEEQLDCLLQQLEVDIVYGSVRYFTSENPTEHLFAILGENKPWMPEISGQGKSILLALLHRNIMVVNAPLIRRQVIDLVGFFDPQPRGVEDWDYWIRCAAMGIRFQYNGSLETLALVRSHPLSMTMDRRGMLRGELEARKKVSGITDDKDALILNNQKMAECLAWLGVEELKFHNNLRGSYNLIRAGFAGRKLLWVFCALIGPFISKQRLEGLAHSTLTSYLTSALRHRLRLSF